MRVVELGVRDDDPAAFVVSPGPRWTLDDDGRLQLDETATQAAIVRIRTAGDPTADVTITPRATATGQLEVSPASVTIPAGSHEQVVSFSVRAVNDREDEAATHAAKIEWKVASGDVLYAGATMPNTFARIKDAGSVSLRGETDKVDPVAPDPRPTSTGPAYSGPEPASPDPVDPSREARDGDKPPGEIVGDDESDPVDDGSGDDDSSRERSSTAPKNDADTKRDESLAGKPVKRLKHWAGEHKAKAAVGVSAAGTAAIWAFKPLALAGKALGTGGGGLPHPPGMTQLRHLFKRRNLRRIKNNARRLHRRGKGRPFDDDEDDWDDFLWGDRAA
jgi:hypothetical protein